MVFVIRKLRTLDDIKNYKVCLVNDRKDLEDQLGKTANLTGEKVFYITSTNQLRDKLASNVSNLNMVMIHKFQENQGKEIPDYVKSALEHIPTFVTFGIVNSSERILLMLDEDPAFYSKLSEKLERLIQLYKDNWEELYNQLFHLWQKHVIRK